MKNKFSVSSQSIHHNAKIWSYPDGNYKLRVASSPIYKESGWESASFIPNAKISKPKDMTNDTRDDSINRAKTSICDIGRLNDFTMFVTLTLNAKKIDRYDIDEIRKKVKSTFSNLVERYNILYLLIPELHKDGAIHFHGLIKGPLKIVDSGKVKVNGKRPIDKDYAKRLGYTEADCKVVYNLPQWKWGFSNAVIIPEEERTFTVKYMTKYITKDCQKIFGNFYFAGGDGLLRKPPSMLTDMDYNKVAYDWEIVCPYTGVGFKGFDSSNFKPQKSADDIFNEEGYIDLDLY